ncbi:hypothetical protein ACHAWF_016780 [Thalassiosira exigua]
MWNECRQRATAPPSPPRLVRHWRSSAAGATILLLSLSLNAQVRTSGGFSTSSRSAARPGAARPSLQHFPTLRSEVQSPNFVDVLADDDDDDDGLPELTGSLAGCTVHEYELKEHKPLGCSVEESMASELDGAKYVFVAEVNSGGNAIKVGLREGDVIVQLSGTFDEVVDVAGLGIEKIRSLVAGRPEESPLTIRVARGSDVMDRHQMSLVELCIVGDDAATDDCITSIYAADDDVYLAGDGDMAECEDDGTECMLDSIWSDWSEGLVDVVEEKEEEVKVEKKKKAQPWSSRSSPSGTYVRDPKTGKLVNIDE